MNFKDSTESRQHAWIAGVVTIDIAADADLLEILDMNNQFHWKLSHNPPMMFLTQVPFILLFSQLCSSWSSVLDIFPFTLNQIELIITFTV